LNWSDLRLRLHAALFPGRVERELEEEIAAHIELQERKLRQSGLSAQEARRQARLQFGGIGAVKESCRDERRIGFLEIARQDVRYAARGIHRSPGFALAVIATIGLGLGINTAAFTIFNAYVLRPLAVADPYSLYELNWLNRSGRQYGFTWVQYQQIRQDNPAFSEALATRGFQARVDGRQCFAELATPNFFSMLGVNAALGRTALPEREPVAVLSYAAWQRMFAGDPGVIGRKILVHGYPLEVAGVARDWSSSLCPGSDGHGWHG
jgi:hypothetical protein